MAKNGKDKKVQLTPEQKLASKQQAFYKVVTPRVNRALKSISLVGNCASSNYSYTPEQAAKIIDALTLAVEQVAGSYAKRVQRTTEFKLG